MSAHKTPKHSPLQHWIVEVDSHSAMMVSYALALRLMQVSYELDILKRTKIRDLKQIERFALPSNLQGMTQEQLQEQIDPWITLEEELNHWMQQFQPPEKQDA